MYRSRCPQPLYLVSKISLDVANNKVKTSPIWPTESVKLLRVFVWRFPGGVFGAIRSPRHQQPQGEVEGATGTCYAGGQSIQQ